MTPTSVSSLDPGAERRWHALVWAQGRQNSGSPVSVDSPPDPDQRAGYLVLLRAEHALERWRDEVVACSRDPVKFQDYVAVLRRMQPGLAEPRYGGIQRYPLERGEAGPSRTGADLRAARRMLELYGPDPTVSWKQPPWFDPDLIDDPVHAREILALTDDPREHELAYVVRGTASPDARTLGFDVGYWGSDHFSLIADVFVMPQWHPAPLTVLDVLAVWAARLNSRLLFTTAQAAAEYREWYRAQDWAEQEAAPDQFQIIRVDQPSELARS